MGATLEQSIKPETLVEVMLSSNEAWKEVTTFATKVIQDLCREEQQRNKSRMPALKPQQLEERSPASCQMSVGPNHEDELS